MKTLYLHIGTSKTGTTAIQAFCRENEEALHQHGYCYPCLPFKYENVSNNRNGHFLIAGQGMEEDRRDYRKGMRRILKCFHRYPNIILSDEGIWSESYANREALWKRLNKEGQRQGFVVRVIVYLRRQDQYMESTWNQMVKSGLAEHADEPWASYVSRRAKLGKLDYAKRVDRLIAVFGRPNVIVRRFEPDRFYGGSIYADFLNAVGLDFTDEYQIGKEQRNLRLMGNTQEIKRILNGLAGVNEEGQKFFRNVLKSFSELSGEQYPSAMFSQEEAQEFMRQYEEGNRMLAQEYFGEEELFDMSWKGSQKWQQNNEKMWEDLVRFVGACFMQLLESR